MIGQTVSHYRILEKIGRGGMGEIYLAEDTKLERKVALKFLPRQFTEDKDARLRFEREAKAAAALNHPNIVTVYEIGEHEGQVFIAMEYVEGRTLKELISVGADPRVCPDSIGIQKKGKHSVGARRAVPSSGDLSLPIASHPLPLTQVIDIACQIASGLAAAHAKGIVHRDIKPQNILIDKSNRVKILDFGLAKLQGVSRLTQEAFTMGTVHYMSPEQGMGKEVDLRSDIWSLGVVLYEMVSGGLPFRGEYDQAVIYAIVNEEPPPLASGKTPAGAGMENIIRCCLAKKRQDRYQTAEALAKALRDLSSAREATKPEKSSGRRLSRRAFLTTLSLLLLSGILGFIALTPRANASLRRMLGLTGMPRGRHMAVLPLLASGDAEAKALGNGFTAVMIDKLTWLEKFNDSFWTVPAERVFQYHGMSPRALQRLWGCDLFIAGDLQAEKNLLRLHLRLEDARTGHRLNKIEIQGHMGNLSLFQDGLLAKLCQLLEIKEDPGAAKFINAGGTAMPGAYMLFLKGKGSIPDSKNVAGIDLGIVGLEKALQQDNGYVQARLALAEALYVKFKINLNAAILQKAMQQGLLASQAAGTWAPAQMTWAMLLKESGQKSEALAALEEVLRLNGRCYQACIELANVCTSMGRVNEAEGFYKRAISLRPGYPPAYHNLAYFYESNGRLDEALTQYQKQNELAPGDFNCLINMGNAYSLKGDHAGAKNMFERSIAIQPNVVAQSNLATLYFYEGNYRKALSLFKEAADKSSDCWAWGNLGDTYRQMPEYRDQAAAAYQKAITFAKRALVAAPDDPVFLSGLAMYYAHVGEKSKALESIARVHALAPADLEMIRRAILVYETVQERPQALDALREFHERLGNIDEIEKEPDLADLRRAPEYLQITRDLK